MIEIQRPKKCNHLMLYWGCVIRASINLMHLSMCWRIENLKVVPNRMTLQLVDRSLIIPYGVVEDVLVKVRQFTFLVDFVIIDIEKDYDIPLIKADHSCLLQNVLWA